MNDLALIWAGIIVFCIMMYVILDGFTLGVGMWFNQLAAHERNIAMSTLLPTWDGNQTWLVLGGASLYGAFPKAFSFYLPHFYLPLILMVVMLLFRGVAFEFRLKSNKGKARWDKVFIVASFIVAFIQGAVVGNLSLGFDTPHSFINWFSIITGVGVIIAYMLLGSTRMVLKVQGTLQEKFYRYARNIAVLFFIMVALVSLLAPIVHPDIETLWFSHDSWSSIYILPLLTFLLALLLWLSLKRKQESRPYWLAVCLVFCPYVGFIINLFPYAVPYHITYLQAAAPDNTLSFLLVGAVIMLPVLLAYTGYAYYIFRGKVTDEIQY